MKLIIKAIMLSVHALAALLLYAAFMYSNDAIGAKYVIVCSALWLMQVENLTILEERC